MDPTVYSRLLVSWAKGTRDSIETREKLKQNLKHEAPSIDRSLPIYHARETQRSE